MIVFVYDIETDELKEVHYDVINIEKQLLTDYLKLSICGVLGNEMKLIDRDKYYIKVV